MVIQLLLYHMSFLILQFTCRIQNSDIPRAGRDGAAHGGTEGRGGDGQDGRRRVGSPRRQPSLLLPRRSKKTSMGVSVEARTRETQFKPVGEQNVRLTTVL